MGCYSGTQCNVPRGHYSGSQMYVPMPILPWGHYFVCWNFRPTKYTQTVWANRSATAWIRLWTLWTLNQESWSYPHGLWCHLAHLHTVKVASFCQVETTFRTSVDLDVSNSIGISGTQHSLVSLRHPKTQKETANSVRRYTFSLINWWFIYLEQLCNLVGTSSLS